MLRADPRDPARSARSRWSRPPPLARARAANAERMDGPQGRGRREDRGHVPSAPGAAERGEDECRAPAHARELDAQLPAAGAVRRRRPVGARRGGIGPGRRATDGGEPACQWRPRGAARSSALPGLRDRRAPPGDGARRIDPAARQAHARRLCPHQAARQLQALLPGRNQLESPRRRLRGGEPLPRGARAAGRRPRVAGRARDGGTQRAPLSGLARGLHAHRASRALRDLRGVRDGVGLHDGAARQVARGERAASVAKADPVAQRAAHLDRAGETITTASVIKAPA